MKPNIVYIIGAGQIGSRHLQALKGISRPLIIWVIDPLEQSLQTSRERYDAMPAGRAAHVVHYEIRIPRDKKLVDLAIIATTSDIRRKVLETLLRNHTVRYVVLEKLLFNKKRDYAIVEKLLRTSKTRAWVNCLRRMIPSYVTLSKNLRHKKLHYSLSGSNLRLASNAIHFIDHAVDLIGSSDFRIISDGLDKKIISSKRRGFVELTGTLLAQFNNGSSVSLTSYPFGNMPPLVTIESDAMRYIIDESRNKALKADHTSQWQEIPFQYPLQSQISTTLVQTILSKGNCLLPTYAESQKIHLKLLESLRLFLNDQGKKKYTYYPFT